MQRATHLQTPTSWPHHPGTSLPPRFARSPPCAGASCLAGAAPCPPSPAPEPLTPPAKPRSRTAGRGNEHQTRRRAWLPIRAGWLPSSTNPPWPGETEGCPSLEGELGEPTPDQPTTVKGAIKNNGCDYIEGYCGSLTNSFNAARPSRLKSGSTKPTKQIRNAGPRFQALQKV